jgi:hypothetical protein
LLAVAAEAFEPPLQPVLRPGRMPPSSHPAVGSVPWPSRLRRGRRDPRERDRAGAVTASAIVVRDGRAGSHDAPMAALVARPVHDECPFVELSARLVPAPDRRQLPASLLERLGGDGAALAVAKLMTWLAPITTTSCPDGSRFVRGAM